MPDLGRWMGGLGWFERDGRLGLDKGKWDKARGDMERGDTAMGERENRRIEPYSEKAYRICDLIYQLP